MGSLLKFKLHPTKQSDKRLLMKRGRPKENRKRMTVHVKDETKKKLKAHKKSWAQYGYNTYGKVIDAKFM